MGSITHSHELKTRACALVEAGYDTADVAFMLGVSDRSIRRWRASFRQWGDVQRPGSLALRGRRRVLNTVVLEEIRDLVRSFPSLYLDEITTWLALEHNQPISIATIHRNLVSLGFTYKKLRKTSDRRDEITRAQWKADITSRFRPEQLVFADESSKNGRTALRNYGRAMAGERACEVVSLDRGTRYSILPALSVDGFLTVRVVEGSVNGAEFYQWVVSDLLPKMNPFPGPNSILIIDNCHTHKSNAVRLAVESAGCLLIFLPTYSPDLNPIEEAFSCVKYQLRRWGDPCLHDDLPEVRLMEFCMGAVTAEKARGWYAHSGYV